MRVTGSPDLVAFATLSRTVSQVRDQLARAAREAVTGEREDLARVLGARAGELSLVDKALGDLTAGEARLSLAQGRLRQTGAALDAIRLSVENLGERALTDTVLGGGVGTAETAQTARSRLDGVLATLNTTHAGRSLFAGDEVDGPAVGSTDQVLAAARDALTDATTAAEADVALDAFFAAGGGFDTFVYLGGEGEAAEAALGDGSSVRFDIKADAGAPRAVIEGLVRLALLHEVPGEDTAWVETAASRLETGVQGLIGLQSQAGLAANRVEGRVAAAAAERLVFTATREALAGRDAYEAASEVQRLEVQLEAAYTLTARIGRLTFSDYMR